MYLNLNAKDASTAKIKIIIKIFEIISPCVCKIIILILIINSTSLIFVLFMSFNDCIINIKSSI